MIIQAMVITVEAKIIWPTFILNVRAKIKSGQRFTKTHSFLQLIFATNEVKLPCGSGNHVLCISSKGGFPFPNRGETLFHEAVPGTGAQFYNFAQ